MSTAPARPGAAGGGPGRSARAAPAGRSVGRRRAPPRSLGAYRPAAIAARYSPSAWMSELTVMPSVACAAAAAIAARVAARADQRGLDGLGAVGDVADAGDARLGPSRSVAAGAADDGGDADDRVAGGPLLERVDRPSRRRRRARDAELGQELVVGAVPSRRRPGRSRRPRYDPLAALRAERRARASRASSDGGHVRGRVGVGDRAAERAPVANLDVADAVDRPAPGAAP